MNRIRIDPWSAKPRSLILTESRSLARRIAQSRTGVRGARSPRPTAGAGGFLHTDVAPALSDRARVLYSGDFDLAGADIEANTRRVLERNRNRDLAWERLALTREQVDLYSLPVITEVAMGASQMAARS